MPHSELLRVRPAGLVNLMLVRQVLMSIEDLAVLLEVLCSFNSIAEVVDT